MSDAEHEVALEDTDRIHGRTALVRNVAAAVSLSNAVRSTLGPRGLDKMLVDEEGNVRVTNDGVTVLETARVEHPTANLLIASSSSVYFITYKIGANVSVLTKSHWSGVSTIAGLTNASPNSFSGCPPCTV